MNLLVFNLRTDADDGVLGFTTDWLNGLAAYCERVVVITMASGKLAVASNVQVYSVGKERGYSKVRRLFEFYRLLTRVLHTETIDACFAHMMPLFAALGAPVLRARGIPTMLWYAHSSVPPMLRIATRLCDRVVASSASGFRLKTEKLHIIGQGIDVERFKPGPVSPATEHFRILTLGRIAPVKRLEILIEALALLPPVTPDGRKIVARYIGDPLTPDDQAYAGDLRSIAERRGVANRIEFSPGVSFRVADAVYREADLFVNSSDTGSVDKTVLEAMSTGLTCITSNVAFRSIFDREYQQICLAPPSDPQKLAERIWTIVTMSPDDRRALGLRMRQTVCRDHSLDALCGRLYHHLTELCGARSGMTKDSIPG